MHGLENPNNRHHKSESDNVIPMELRLEIKRAWVQGEGTFKQLSEKYGVNDSTIRNWSVTERWAMLRKEFTDRKEAEILPPPLPAVFDGSMNQKRYIEAAFIHEHARKYFLKLNQLDEVLEKLEEAIAVATPKDLGRLAMAWAEVLLTKAKVLRIPTTPFETRAELAPMKQVDEVRESPPDENDPGEPES